MNILVFDPLWAHCVSAVGALIDYRGVQQVVTVRNVYDVTGSVIPELDLRYDGAIFRIPSVVSGGRQDIQPRSARANETLQVVMAAMRARIQCIVSPTPWPIWFYRIGTDEPADGNIFFRPIDPNTNVFTDYYIAPDWRYLLDALLDEN